MAIDKLKRSFIWLRNVFRVIDKTTLPGEIAGTIGPTVDVFGWERFAPALVGDGPQSQAFTGVDATDSVLTSVVPDGVMRLVMRASMSHDDPVGTGLVMSMQVRSQGIDIAISDGIFAMFALPLRQGLDRMVLLAPGDRLLCRSNPAPAALTSLFIRWHFVDVPFGEYIAPIN